ncbi:MAG: histidine kinase, partial [Burkholderiaceae bacterium]|nr:histidine kinase [Burkholderiaceae bacterium]
ELHDSLGHHLVALNLQLDLAQRVPAARREGHVAAAGALSQGMLGEVRRVVSALRAEPVPDLPAALAALQAAVPEPRIHLQLDDELPELTPVQAHTLLRCVQEGVSNTLRHAAANNLWVRLGAEGGSTLRLSLRDDGAGTAALRCGNGLTGMHERVQAVGGTMQVQSAAGEGFRIEVCLGVEATS